MLKLFSWSHKNNQRIKTSTAYKGWAAQKVPQLNILCLWMIVSLLLTLAVCWRYFLLDARSHARNCRLCDFDNNHERDFDELKEFFGESEIRRNYNYIYMAWISGDYCMKSYIRRPSVVFDRTRASWVEPKFSSSRIKERCMECTPLRQTVTSVICWVQTDGRGRNCRSMGKRNQMHSAWSIAAPTRVQRWHRSNRAKYINNVMIRAPGEPNGYKSLTELIKEVDIGRLQGGQ